MKIYLGTIGCRLNQAEIESFARQFRTAGHVLVANPEDADLAVVNTCTVTAAAASDSRQKVRQLARTGVAEVVVTGCWSTMRPQEAAALPGVVHVIPNQEKDTLVPDLFNLTGQSFDLEPVEKRPDPGGRMRTRAFIKVQDGCNNRCTFCITSLARGRGRSRSIADVLEEINRVGCNSEANGDAKEVVLTGVHLGSWGQDLSPELSLRHLLRAILDQTPTPRLRLSSLEPWDLNEGFFELWENPRLCRHLHLPLQSGCHATLRRMGRKTSPDSYAGLVSYARAAIPGVAITTDIIVGFPGECEVEFSESLAMVEEMQFAGGHVFTYSARPGTAAAHMPGQVPHAISKERSTRVRTAFNEAAHAYQLGFIDQILPVLWESAISLGPDGWEMSGLTDNYLRVDALAPRHLWNQITPVKLSGMTDNGLYGQIQL